MDLKVYTKETVRQPSGDEYVVSPNIIDIIPDIIETESTGDFINGTWNIDALKRVADVSIENGRLVINSDNVRFENGNIYITLTQDTLFNAQTVEDDAEIEQACLLSTIWQKGLDPLDLDVGIRWSEALLNEINVVQLMEDITNAVASVTPSVTVVFDTVTDSNGNSYLKYTLKAVA